MPSSSDNHAIRIARGRIIAEAREAKGLTQEQLARKLGASSGIVISRWETGTNGISPRFMQRLADVLDLPIEQLTDPPVPDLCERIVALEAQQHCLVGAVEDLLRRLGGSLGVVGDG